MGFLDPGQPIVERLRTRFAAEGQLVDVITAVDGASILDEPFTRPCVFVIFDSYLPVQEQAQGAIQQIEQKWAAILKVRQVSGVNLGDGAPMNAAESPVIDVMLGALCGWRPCTGFEPMRMGDGAGPAFSSGYAYYPLFFTTRTVVRGVP